MKDRETCNVEHELAGFKWEMRKDGEMRTGVPVETTCFN